MKFDYVIGNPPFQEESKGEVSKLNGQKPRKNVFQKFQEAVDDVTEGTSVLIYPAVRWMHRSGKGCEDFGLQQINDTHLSQIVYYEDAKEVFPNVAIPDGVSIVVKNQDKTEDGFEYVYVKGDERIEINLDNPGEELITLNPKDTVITDKIAAFVTKNNLTYLHDGILPRTFFGIDSDYVETHPNMLRPYNDGDDIDFNTEVKIFTNDKAGKAGRAKWFVGSRNIIPNNQDKISEYQVVVSSANAGGQKRDNQLEIMDNHSAFGRARVALRSFKTKTEAENFYKYVKSYIVRFAFLMTDEPLTSLGKAVPDLQDYTNKNKIINFKEDIDVQLKAKTKMDLTEEEFAYIVNRVNSIRKEKE